MRFFVMMCRNVFSVWPKMTLLQCGPETPKGWTPLLGYSRISTLTQSAMSYVGICTSGKYPIYKHVIHKRPWSLHHPNYTSAPSAPPSVGGLVFAYRVK